MSVQKGDVVRIQWDCGAYRARILATTKQGFRAVWLDGPLEGRRALIERSIVVHRGRPSIGGGC